MSVRAYKVIEIKHEEGESFNLWHDTDVMDFLENEGCLSTLNSDGCGFIAIDIEMMKRMLDTLNPELTQQFRKDYDAAVASGEDSIDYLCF
jgi:hypothetical protein